ncbi:recombinase zinc beta ribbon domain-containing protein [Streptomyces sp. NPDC018019]|uniref:recombinase zinc beta ribbon domain-containing protein n=1 Tax=Streptomyces sp. NPDC018019 TaxID=3365030 RepID=UPI0037957772
MSELYRRHVAGDGSPQLCAWLNNQGYRTTRNTLCRSETLERYMDSGFPAGLLRIHDLKCTCGNRLTNGGCPNHFLIGGAHEEVIALDLWQQYQERRRQIKETAPRSRKADYMLSGLVRHQTCRGGTSLNPQQSTRKKKKVITPGHAYRCSSRIPSGGTACDGVWIQREKVEAAFLRRLRTKAAGIDQAPAAEQQQRDLAAERRRVVKHRTELQAQHAKSVEALKRLAVDNALDPDKYPEGRYEEARGTLVAQRDTIKRELDKVAEAEELPRIETFRPLAVGLIEEWGSLLTTERNAIIRQLVRRVMLIRNGEPGEDGLIEIRPVWEPDPWTPPAVPPAEGASELATTATTAELALAG